MKIEFLNVKKLEKDLKKMKSAVSKAEVRALNNTAKKVKTQAAKKTGQEVALTAKYIKSKLIVTKANKNKLYSSVYAEKRGILLSRYNSKQLKKRGKNAGISIKVGRKGTRKKIRNAFYIKLKNSNVVGIAFRKKGKTGKNDYEVKHGPSVSQVWMNIRNNMIPESEKWLQETMIHELNYEMKKIGL